MRILIKTPTEPYSLPSSRFLFPRAGEGDNAMSASISFIPTETSYYIDIPETTTIQSIKYIIQDKEKVQHDACRLIYNGQWLENTQTLIDCDIQEEPVFHLGFPVRGIIDNSFLDFLISLSPDGGPGDTVLGQAVERRRDQIDSQ